jgi:hypothetical protein
MFQELNRKGEPYQTWVYKPFKIDGRKKKVYKVKEGTVFNEIGKIGRQVLSTQVRALQKEGWKLHDDLIAPVIETPVAEKVVEIEPPKKLEPDCKASEDTVAERLLKGEGLNFSSFIRALGKDHKDQKVRKDMRGEYNEILEYHQDKHKDKIYKQGHDWFLKDK